MKISIPHALTAGALALACLSAHAGGTISFGDGQSVTVGFGMRTDFTSISNGAPNGTDRSEDFNLESVRLYLSGSLTNEIKGTFNTERTAGGTVQVIDSYVQFEPMPEFNLWAGRMLPPSDRANLDGPYYLLAWSYPGVVSQYPSKAVGRDDGVLAWGKVFDKKVVYSVGAFEGRNRTGALTSNQDANLLYAGRVAINFWDPEPAPAYYTGSTYGGSANILTLAFAGMFEKNGVGNIVTPDDYKAWNADLLMETKLGSFGPGSLTLEGAYYKYDFSVASAVADITGGVTPGDAQLFGAGYMFPEKVGWGKFQPYYRYQKFKGDGAFATTKQSDLGLNYLIDGPNAKVSGTFTNLKTTGLASTNMFMLGLQVQF